MYFSTLLLVVESKFVIRFEKLFVILMKAWPEKNNRDNIWAQDTLHKAQLMAPVICFSVDQCD